MKIKYGLNELYQSKTNNNYTVILPDGTEKQINDLSEEELTRFLDSIVGVDEHASI